MKKFFHCEMPRLVVLLTTLVYVAWLPTLFAKVNMLWYATTCCEPPGRRPNALVKKFV